MTVVKISTKGQLVIPQDLRKEMGIGPNDVLQVEEVNGMVVLKKIELGSLEKELKGGKQ